MSSARWYRFMVCGGALILAAPALHAASGSPAETCAELAGANTHDTVITLAQLNPAAQGLPEHCEVIGAINTRTSRVDGQTYAIGFHLRMPTDWNRRFFYQGGGGTDGNLGAANAPQLQQGYAVVSTDSGHDNAKNTSTVAGSFQFGFDPQARSDYGYNGPAEVSEKAKALIKKFYGRSPRYSYFAGCSEGGREGLMLSQRYPEFFDGIVAGNPGMDLPKAAVAEAWDSQAFGRAAARRLRSGIPISRAPSPTPSSPPWAMRSCKCATHRTAWSTAWCLILRRVASIPGSLARVAAVRYRKPR